MARTARSRVWSTRSAMAASSRFSSAISRSKCLIWLMMASSPAPAGDVVLGLLLAGIGEDLQGAVELDQLAEVEEGGLVAGAGRLLHVVGDHHHGEVFLQPQHS